MVTAVARGVLYVHSSPRALCPHVEWAAGSVLGAASVIGVAARAGAAASSATTTARRRRGMARRYRRAAPRG